MFLVYNKKHKKKNSTVTSGAKLSMIVGTGFEKKNEPIRFPRGIRRRRPNHENNRYVYRP